MRNVLVCMMGIAAFGILLPAAWGAETSVSGSFTWRSKKYELAVKLTPKKDTTDEWAAVYTFKKGKEQGWNGTMKGSLKSGELSGDAVFETRKRKVRNFIFRGTIKEGKMVDGKTYEIKKGKETATAFRKPIRI